VSTVQDYVSCYTDDVKLTDILPSSVILAVKGHWSSRLSI